VRHSSNTPRVNHLADEGLLLRRRLAQILNFHGRKDRHMAAHHFRGYHDGFPANEIARALVDAAATGSQAIGHGAAVLIRQGAYVVAEQAGGSSAVRSLDLGLNRQLSG
jgi:hypothetical protein